MILNVRPQSQLSPIPMIMGCEGTAASMLLSYNGIHISPKTLIDWMPKHENNPNVGYVGNAFLVKFGVHQTIFPKPLATFLKNYYDDFIDGTGLPLSKLEAVLDTGQPVIIYPVDRGQKPKLRTYRIGKESMTVVANIHAVLLIGYDNSYYYIIDPIKKQYGPIYLPALRAGKRQILKIRKSLLKKSYDDAARLCVFRKVRGETD